MQFVKRGQAEAVRALCERLVAELAAGKRVLWLTSGGSNVPPEVEIMRKLRDHAGSSLNQLMIMPADERYGAPGHPDSNNEQLRRAGFAPGSAEWVDVLARGATLAETVEYYDDMASEALATAQVVVGQFGLGADGHVAGILPGSPATGEGFAAVVGYEWSDYTRLTLSPRALADVDAGYVLAYGDSKRVALERLKANNEAMEELPAGLLDSLPEAYIYNDFIGTGA